MLPHFRAIFVIMRAFLVILAFFMFLDLCSQNQSLKYQKNLIPNGSFENYRKKSSDVRRAIPWRQIQTIDYYHQALDNDTTFDRGAYQGYSYTGFRFRKKYKEFLQVKLAEPLHRGTIYEYKIHLKLAYWSNAQLRSFGALFTKGGYRGQKDVYKGSMVDTVAFKGGLQNGYRWFEVKGYYKSDGGEKYITIGNFSPSINKDLYRVNKVGLRVKEAYYFIDDISLKRAPQFEEKVKVVIVGPSRNDFEEDSV